jgi:hypothetical protein
MTVIRIALAEPNEFLSYSQVTLFVPQLESLSKVFFGTICHLACDYL